MIKRIVLLVVSVGVGSFVTDIMEKTEINVWIGRGIGCLVSVIIALPLYYLWMHNNKTIGRRKK